jgi:hypothetical protein
MIPNNVSLEDSWSVVVRLKDEAQRCLTELEGTAEADGAGKSFWGSMYARAVFAFIDGTVYGLLYHAYVGRNRPDVKFSAEEMSRLEAYFDFDESREAVSTFSKGDMLSDLKFAFVAFARAHSSDYALPIGDRNWVLITESAHIRKTLEGALTGEALEVYPESVDVLLHGMAWFVERVVDLMKSSVDALSEEARDDGDDNALIM